MSRTSAQHRRRPASRQPAAGHRAGGRHRRLRRGLVSTIAACCLAGAVFAAARFWPGDPVTARTQARAASLLNGLQLTAIRFGHIMSSGSGRRPKPVAGSPAIAAPAPPVYQNPLRDVSGLVPERIDMGVDFGGSGPVYALGDAVITKASSAYPGWPGGGWVTYRLTDGPAAGLMVYVAEDVTPDVVVGQRVSSSTVVATMYNGGDGIETGWAQPDGSSAESQLPVAGPVGGNGPFPTWVGLSFERLLVILGVRKAPNYGQAPFGLLPPGYADTWAMLRVAASGH